MYWWWKWKRFRILINTRRTCLSDGKKFFFYNCVREMRRKYPFGLRGKIIIGKRSNYQWHIEEDFHLRENNVHGEWLEVKKSFWIYHGSANALSWGRWRSLSNWFEVRKGRRGKECLSINKWSVHSRKTTNNGSRRTEYIFAFTSLKVIIIDSNSIPLTCPKKKNNNRIFFL